MVLYVGELVEQTERNQFNVLANFYHNRVEVGAIILHGGKVVFSHISIDELIGTSNVDVRQFLLGQQFIGDAVLGRNRQSGSLTDEGVTLGLTQVIGDESLGCIDGHSHIDEVRTELGGLHVGEAGSLAVMVAEQAFVYGVVETPCDGNGVVAHVLFAEGCNRRHLHIFGQRNAGQLARQHHIIYKVVCAVTACPALHRIAKGPFLLVAVVVVVLRDVDVAVAIGIAYQWRALVGQFLVLDVACLYLCVLVHCNGYIVGSGILLHAIHVPFQVIADTNLCCKGDSAILGYHFFVSQ